MNELALFIDENLTPDMDRIEVIEDIQRFIRCEVVYKNISKNAQLMWFWWECYKIANGKD